MQAGGLACRRGAPPGAGRVIGRRVGSSRPADGSTCSRLRARSCARSGGRGRPDLVSAAPARVPRDRHSGPRRPRRTVGGRGRSRASADSDDGDRVRTGAGPHVARRAGSTRARPSVRSTSEAAVHRARRQQLEPARNSPAWCTRRVRAGALETGEAIVRIRSHDRALAPRVDSRRAPFPCAA
jgi:hypothetical protein